MKIEELGYFATENADFQFTVQDKIYEGNEIDEDFITLNLSVFAINDCGDSLTNVQMNKVELQEFHDMIGKALEKTSSI